MKKYDNFISLGYFCSVALELSRIGLRSKSSPFDWCISDFEGVLMLIENHFEDLFNYDLIMQSDVNRSHYFNKKYGIWFYHDFDKYYSLKRQLPKVAEKYARRIERFYTDIQQPTLFVRYISDKVKNDKGVSSELEYIEKNYAHIISLLKSFNQENEILFIANEGVNSNLIKIYNVEKDDGDGVARRPLDKNSDLYKLLMSFEYDLREKNIEFSKNQKKNNSISKKIFIKGVSFIKKKIRHEYIHEHVIFSIT